MFRSKFAYVPNLGDNSIANFSTNATNGSLVAQGTTASGNSPVRVVSAQGSTFAYSANTASNTIAAYSINSTNGVLSPVTAPGGSQPTVTPTGVLAIDPTGRFAYTLTTDAAGLVNIYTVSRQDGTLTPNGNSSSVPSPVSMAVDPTGRNLYVLTATQLRVLWINNSTGAVSPPFGAPGPPFGSGVISLFGAGGGRHFAIDPSSRVLYVASTAAGGSIERYAIDPYGGIPTNGTQLITGKPNVSIAIDPTGRFAYTADNTANTVTAYAINQTTGTLTSPTTISTAPNAALHVNVDYAGSVVQVVLGNNSVASYAINQTNGTLTQTPAGIVATGLAPGPITSTGEVE